MKNICLNSLPSRAAALDCLALIRAAYGPGAKLAHVAAGPYFYRFHAVYEVPAVDGWAALVSSMTRTGRGDWLY